VRFNSQYAERVFQRLDIFADGVGRDVQAARRRSKPTNLGADHYADRFKRRSNQ
jgi:hypothetical protein